MFANSFAFISVAVAALIWVNAALSVLVTPDDARVPVFVVVGLILAGGVYFAKMMVVDRHVLDDPPSEP